MANATITFQDDGNDSEKVHIRLDFSPAGSDDSSGAHRTAMQALSLLVRANQHEVLVDEKPDELDD